MSISRYSYDNLTISKQHADWVPWQKKNTAYYRQWNLTTFFLEQFIWTPNFCYSENQTYNASPKVQRFTVPQKFFLHFYVVGVVVTTTLLLAIWFYAYMKMTPLVLEPSSYSTIASHLVGSSNSFSLASFWSSRPREHKYRVWRTVFVLILMEIQVLRRLYETEHVFHYSPSARMHIMGYLTGLL